MPQTRRNGRSGVKVNDDEKGLGEYQKVKVEED